MHTPARSKHGPRRRRNWSRRKRWLAAAPLALFLAGPPTVRAQDLSQIEFQYLSPAGPGSRFALAYQVPTHLHTAVLITNGAVEIPESPASVPDLSGALVFPLPVDPMSGATGFEGTVPDTITVEQIAQSEMHLWIVLYDPLTDEAWLSDPLPIQGLPSEPPPAPVELDVAGLATYGLVQTASGPSSEENGVEPEDAEGEEDEDSEIWASTSDDGSDDGTTPTPHKPFNVGVPSIPWISDIVNILNLSNISGTSLLTSIHDQSTPVQGSGH